MSGDAGTASDPLSVARLPRRTVIRFSATHTHTHAHTVRVGLLRDTPSATVMRPKCGSEEARASKEVQLKLSVACRRHSQLLFGTPARDTERAGHGALAQIR